MKTILNVVSTTVIASLVLALGYMGLEPTMVGAVTVSSSVIVTLNVTAGIAINNPPNTAMSNALGTSQQTAIATSTWTVKTNNYLGYYLTVQAATAPAMQASSTAMVPDYQTGAPNNWVTTLPAFGYGVIGTDRVGAFTGANTNCGATSTPVVGGGVVYKGFTTAPFTIASRTSTTTTTGVDTIVCFAVDQGTTNYIANGTYTANITATAITN